MRWRQSEGDDQVPCDLRDRGVPCGQRLDPDGALREVDQPSSGGAMIDFWNDAEWDKVLRHRKQAYREGVRDGVACGAVLVTVFAYIWCYFGGMK